MDRFGRPPSAEELSSLTAAFQRDPATGFVPLGEAYLALGRPQEAIDIGARGLTTDPNSATGRIMVARAFSMLHQWKEAQAELLKVVKIHKDHHEGFRMLGEVLLRRTDYARAMPVLMHAQNLSPADPDVLNLLRSARARTPLEPPPPVPTPMSPAPLSSPPPGPPGDGQMTRGASPGAFARSSESMVSAQESSSGRQSPPRLSATAPQGPGQVRPRVVSNQKPVGVAQASLRMSAAVGEQHLPRLLSGGLLELPNVRAARVDYQVAPVKRFGRSAVQLVMTFGVVVVLCGLSAGGWYWFTESTKRKETGADLSIATRAVLDGTQEGLIEGTTLARGVLSQDGNNAQAAGLLAQNAGIRALLFGDLPDEEVDAVLVDAMAIVKDETSPGWFALLVGRGAAGVVGVGPDANRLPEVAEQLARAPEDDRVARWMLGRVKLAMGDRIGAREALEAAHDSGAGLPLASIDLGHFFLDEGDFEGALTIFNAVLEKEDAPKLAHLGRALTQAERGNAIAEVMKDISVGLAGFEGKRVEARRAVALAAANLVLMDYDSAVEELSKGLAVSTPRWLVRVGLYQMEMGKISEARAARKRIVYRAKEPPAPHPLERVLDAELLWFVGKSRAAEKKVGKAGDMRSSLVRGKTLFDRGLFRAALSEFKSAREQAPEHRWTNIWYHSARMVTAKAKKQRDDAYDELKKLSNFSKDSAARLPFAVALLREGEYEDARRLMKNGLSTINEEYPNTLIARSRTVYADALTGDGDPDEAIREARLALEEMPDYQPAREALCLALARDGSGKAREACAEAATGKNTAASVLIGQALIAGKDKKSLAASLLKRAKDRGAADHELRYAIKVIDDDLFDELSVSKR